MQNKTNQIKTKQKKKSECRSLALFSAGHLCVWEFERVMCVVKRERERERDEGKKVKTKRTYGVDCGGSRKKR